MKNEIRKITKWCCPVIVFMFFIMFGCAFSGFAASNGPIVTYPANYEEVPCDIGLTITWNPPAGVNDVDYYIVSIRRFYNETVYDSNIQKFVVLRKDSLIVNREFVSSGVDQLSLSRGQLRSGDTFRLSVCAVTTSGRELYSDERYFHATVHAGVLDGTASFKIWNGFSDETKSAVYYSCVAWNNAIDLDREVVNTYPFSQGLDSSTVDYEDNINSVVPIYDYERTYLMLTTYTCYTGSLGFAHADITVNKIHDWANSQRSGYYDVQNAMTHEFGHVVGLNDKYDSWSTEWTMYGYCDTNEIKKRSLHSVDINSVYNLYDWLR